MTFRILFQISVLLLTLQRGTSTGRYYNNKVTVTIVYCFTDSCLPEDLDKIRLTGPRKAVQLCVRRDGRVDDSDDYLWYYIQTQDSWINNLRAANLACRELGLSYTGKIILSCIIIVQNRIVSNQYIALSIGCKPFF